jgi:nitrite reductase/ring-hydroxylating ferredoxin subunit
VRLIGQWVVGRSKGEDFAVSRRCRHQLADLSKGTVDADGCLVCPWHQSRYDVRTGDMVDGPRGFLGYHGPAPVYSGIVRAYSKVLRLRVGKVRRTPDGEITVEK